MKTKIDMGLKKSVGTKQKCVLSGVCVRMQRETRFKKLLCLWCVMWRRNSGFEGNERKNLNLMKLKSLESMCEVMKYDKTKQ